MTSCGCGRRWPGKVGKLLGRVADIEVVLVSGPGVDYPYVEFYTTNPRGVEIPVECVRQFEGLLEVSREAIRAAKGRKGGDSR